MRMRQTQEAQRQSPQGQASQAMRPPIPGSTPMGAQQGQYPGVQQGHPGQVSPGNMQMGAQAMPGKTLPPPPKPWTLYLKSKNKSCEEAFGHLAKNASLKDIIEVINVVHEKPPTWLQGVPCLVEKNLVTGQQRAHYGTASLKALGWLAANHRPSATTGLASAGPGSFGGFDSFNLPLEASGQACQVNGGCPLDNAFEFPKEYSNGASKVTETDMQSLLAVRQQQEALRGNAPPPQVSFLEPENNNNRASMDDLMRQRMASDAMVMARAQRQL